MSDVSALFEPRAFVRVYRMPEKLTNGYCFGPGVPITFLNVDWFEARIAGGREELTDWIKGKRYYDPAASFLVQSDHPDFTFCIPAIPPIVTTGA